MLIHIIVSALLLSDSIYAQTELRIGVVKTLSLPVQATAVALFNFTINELNANGLFPIPIRLIIRDSQNSIRHAVMQADDLVKNYNISALLAEWSSTITLPLATAMSPYSIPQCSSATTADLSNKVEYPYFFRSVSSDVIAANSFVTLALSLGWKRVALLSTILPYGLGLQKAFNAAAVMSGIQIVSNRVYISGTTNFSSQFDEFQNVGARVILLFGYDAEIPYILKEASSRGMWGPNYVYAGANTANSAYDSLYAPGVVLTSDIIQKRALMDGFIINNANENFIPDIFTSLNARFFASTGLIPKTSNYFANDCLLGFIAGFNNLLAQGVTMGQIASRTIPNFSLGSFLNVSITSATGQANYDSNGERHGDFLFSSVTNGTKRPVAIVHSDKSISLLNGGFVFALGSIIVPSDSPLMSEIIFDTSQSGVLILAIIVIAGAVAAFISILVSLRFRKRESVKAISPNISLIVALGIVFSLLSNLSYIGARATRNRCVSHLYASHLSIATVLAFIIMKAYRILKIFDNTADKKRRMGDGMLVVKGTVLVAIMAVIVAIGDILAPINPAYVLISGTLNFYYECRSSTNASIGVVIGYELLLVIAAYVLAYKTRHAYAAYNESKYIRMAVQNIVASNVISRFIGWYLGDSAFMVKLYVQGFLFAYSDIFLFVVLIVRPLFRAIFGSTKEGFKANAGAAAGGTSSTGKHVRMIAATATTRQAVQSVTKNSVGFMREEGRWFQNWKTYLISQNENGMYCTLLTHREGADAGQGVKGEGLFFAAGMYEIEMHVKEADAINVTVDGKVFSVQFEERADAEVWINDIMVKREVKEAKAALRARYSINSRRQGMFQKPADELE